MLPRDSERFDLVITSYVLSELKDNTERQECLLKLWKKTKEGGILVTYYSIFQIGTNNSKVYRRARYPNRFFNDKKGTAGVIGK